MALGKLRPRNDHGPAATGTLYHPHLLVEVKVLAPDTHGKQSELDRLDDKLLAENFGEGYINFAKIQPHLAEMRKTAPTAAPPKA